MSLATRCTSCNTVFRVVQDQLKVSEGWVRCGRCHEVFNALESLFDLEPAASAGSASEPTGPAEPARAQAAALPDAALREASHEDEGVPPLVPAPSTPAAHASSAPLPATGDDSTSPSAALVDGEPSAEPDAPASSNLAPPIHAVALPPAWPPPAIDATMRSGLSSADDTPASRLAARDRNDFEDARFNSELFADDDTERSAERADDLPSPVPDNPERAGDGVAATPDFLRRAERSARWNRPAVVAAMALVCGVLLLGLAAQAVHHFRDLVAASYPQARPALVALCEAAGCRIEPVRRIDDIVIESSALTGAPSGNAIRLAVVLRNRGALPLAMPAIELSLTDAAGQMIARRALLPADFAKAGATLPAAAETPLQLVLAVDGRRPSGYTVEPFYP